MKKWDILLIALLLALSCLPLLLLEQPARTDSLCAEITIDGRLYKRIPLTAHHGREEFVIQTADGSNTITIDEDTIAVTDADCHDHICVSIGKAARPGDTIVCLPHKLIIEIKGTGQVDAPDIIPAH